MAWLTLGASLNYATATGKVPRFSADVAPILARHCVGCHRAGGIGSPIEFTSYEGVRSWAKTIRNVVITRQMPPWSADPKRSLKFKNDPSLSPAEIATLEAWIDAGALKDSASPDPALTAAADNWGGPNGRKPDLVISMNRDVTVPAGGDLPYLRFLVKLPLTEDKWVAASETRPGNATVVHHMAITEVELPDGVKPEDLAGLEEISRRMGLPIGANGVRPAVTSLSNPSAIDMLGIYTPGESPETYPADSGKLLKAGKNVYIDFNIHYSGRSEPATDRSQVAFWFRDTPPLHQIYRVSLAGETILANGRELLTDSAGVKAEGTRVSIPPIPAGDPRYELIAVTAFPEPVTIYQLHPHAHFRAKDFKYSAIYPDGREQTLLTVPQYDFRWQFAYQLQSPLKLPAGSKLVITAHYDNSAANTANPAPDKEVHFLDQNKSTDEMFSPFVQYSVDTEIPGQPAQAEARSEVIETVGCLSSGSATGKWLLSAASKPAPVLSQAAEAKALTLAAHTSVGDNSFKLIGLSPFNPAKFERQEVAVRGVLLNGSASLNVTSLQRIAESCRGR